MMDFGNNMGMGIAQQALKQQKTEPIATVPTGKHMSGSVKSYNPAKGWGLISSPGIPSGGAGKSGDVFFMKSNLPVESRDQDITGYNVTYELMRTPDGKLRAQSIAFCECAQLCQPGAGSLGLAKSLGIVVNYARCIPF